MHILLISLESSLRNHYSQWESIALSLISCFRVAIRVKLQVTFVVLNERFKGMCKTRTFPHRVAFGLFNDPDPGTRRPWQVEQINRDGKRVMNPDLDLRMYKSLGLNAMIRLNVTLYRSISLQNSPYSCPSTLYAGLSMMHEQIAGPLSISLPSSFFRFSLACHLS